MTVLRGDEIFKRWGLIGGPGRRSIVQQFPEIETFLQEKKRKAQETQERNISPKTQRAEK